MEALAVKALDLPAEAWLPEGKSAAVCFTIDDVHPGKLSDAYEAGGDLSRGALSHVEWLLERHVYLHVTLFTTPDWREIAPVPTRKLLQKIPVLRDRVMLARTLPAGTMRLDRHPEFVRYLKSLPRTEIGLHGLYHIHTGPKIFQEFQDESVERCVGCLAEAMAIFRAAELPHVAGMTPPGWDAPPNLLEAMRRVGLRFVASARDIRTAVAPDALADMSGLRGVSLIRPQILRGCELIHFTTNFQATSPIERAREILRHGGLLVIKGHIVRNALGFIMLDGIDGVYCNFLDLLFAAIAREFGDRVWWTSMGRIAARIDAKWLAESRAREGATAC